MATAVVRACRPIIATNSDPNGCIRRSRTGAADPSRTSEWRDGASSSGQSKVRPKTRHRRGESLHELQRQHHDGRGAVARGGLVHGQDLPDDIALRQRAAGGRDISRRACRCCVGLRTPSVRTLGPSNLGARSAHWWQRRADAMLLQFSTMIAATHWYAPAILRSWWSHWRSSCPTARRAPLWSRPSWCGGPRNRPTRPGWWPPGLRMKR